MPEDIKPPSDAELQRRLEEMTDEEMAAEVPAPPGVPDEPQEREGGPTVEEITDEKIQSGEMAGLDEDERVLAALMLLIEIAGEIRDDLREGLGL